VCFFNGRVVAPDGIASSIRFRSTIIGVDDPPRRGDIVVDLNGAVVLPGLINAHDHLELNHYGALKCRERYENAAEWISDMRVRLQSDPHVRANRTYPLASRLFIGALKNLLAGVTTVAHHNPLYPEIRRSVPIRVVRRFGWAHSFLLQDQPVGARGELGGQVEVRYRKTPRDAPFIVHIGEGVDEPAAREVDRLDGLGCLRRNTVLVHGVALDEHRWQRVVESGGSLVWCPASNLFLFGKTVPVREFLDAAPPASARVCVGSDSRVTGSRDLLDELNAAAGAAPVTAPELLRMVTTVPSQVLNLVNAGAIVPGASADLVVLPPSGCDPAESLIGATRRNVSFVSVKGRPLVAARPFSRVFDARRTRPRSLRVDDAQRVADPELADAIDSCPIREPGVECV